MIASLVNGAIDLKAKIGTANNIMCRMSKEIGTVHTQWCLKTFMLYKLDFKVLNKVIDFMEMGCKEQLNTNLCIAIIG